MRRRYQGACLYTPVVHPRLRDVLGGHIRGLQTVVLDLEDGLSPHDSKEAMRILREIISPLEPALPYAYIRPRVPEQMLEILDWGGPTRWIGFVLPKLTVDNVHSWLRPLEGSVNVRIMPILESRDVFFSDAFLDLCSVLNSTAVRERIDAIRLGGADLFGALSLRHPRHRSIHDSILGPHLSFIAAALMARGFAVTAPVCEVLEPENVLRHEVEFAVESGFVGKTAITPRQVELINRAYAVTESELSEATTLLGTSDWVFRSRGAMCEKAPHNGWAIRIKERFEVFGIRGDATVENRDTTG